MVANNHSARVAVPTGFYKIVAFVDPDGSVESLTFVLPHNQANPTGPNAVQYLQNHVTSLADIERRTGLGFFPAHPVIHESSALWAFDQQKMPGSLCHALPTPKFDALWQH
jgi:DNA/RNA endonuclease G (NUC1)